VVLIVVVGGHVGEESRGYEIEFGWEVGSEGGAAEEALVGVDLPPILPSCSRRQTAATGDLQIFGSTNRIQVPPIVVPLVIIASGRCVLKATWPNMRPDVLFSIR
jgi:hypothetical protein